MHELRIKYLRVTNLLSYGAGVTELRLDNDGITWIKGPNGAGKSTIIEGITFALFGTAYRDIPIKELINSSNKGKLIVVIEFDRIDSTGIITYIITRELGRSGSSKLTIETTDGVTVNKPAGMTQKMLEDDIIGFNKNIFDNIISMNTLQTKAFIDMTSAEKRKLIESILTLHIDKIKKLNSTEGTLASAKFSDATNDVQKYSKRLQDLNDVKVTLLREQQDDVIQLQRDLDTNILAKEAIIVRISDNKEIEKNIINKGTEIKNKLTSFDDVDTKLSWISELNQLNKDIIDAEQDVTNALNDMTLKQSAFDEFDVNTSPIKKIISDYGDITTVTNSKNPLVYKIADIRANITVSTKAMDHAKAENDALRSGVACPTCNKLSTDEDIDSIRSNLRISWKTHSDAVKEFKKQLVISEDKLTEVNSLISLYEADYAKYNAHMIKLNSLKSQWEMSISSHSKAVGRALSFTQRIANISNNLNLGNLSIGNIINSLNNRKIEKNGIENELTSLRIDLSRIKDHITHDQSTMGVIDKANIELLARIDKRMQNGNGTSIALTDTQITDANGDLNRAHDRVKKYSDLIAIVKYIDEMYGDQGIKKLILSVFVPNLNQVIAHNIRLFSLPFGVEFDDSLEYEFIGKYGMAQVYNGLSQGQKRKLNFAISMAFRDFVTLIADFKINMMFLDEVLDVSTDEEALRDMVNLIQDKVKDIPNIYLMSHRGEAYEDEWNHVVEIVYDGMYSSLVQHR